LNSFRKQKPFSLGFADKVQALFDPVEFLKARTEPRFVLGIAGPPGVGKSTFADGLAQRLGASAIVLPMDGFHLTNRELDARGLRNRKGAPDTYDVATFLRVLRALRNAGTVAAPAYSRVTHEPEPGAIEILSSHRLILVEGNYLLLDEAPWDDVRSELDEAWYLDASPETIAGRLRARHLAVGRTALEVEEKLRDVDLPNGELVKRSRSRADRRISVNS
jgi:pantothenate kinase